MLSQSALPRLSLSAVALCISLAVTAALSLSIPKAVAQGLGADAQPSIQMQSDQQRIAVKSIVLASQGANEESGVSVKQLSRKAMELRQGYGEELRVDELHQIADALTLYVRDLGYTFDTIYLPPQRVKNNVVHFRYQQATLKHINVINNTDVSDKRISTPFKHLLQRVLYAPRVENMVYALQAQSNISVFAFYSRGKRAGEVVLNLRVDERPSFNYSIRAENYGAEVTGKNRVVGELKHKGLLAAFDQASLALLATQGEGDSTYGFFSYRYPFASLNSEIELGVGDTRYALGDQLESLDTDGNSRTTQLTIKRKIGHSPQKNHSVSFTTFRKESSLETGIEAFQSGINLDEESSGGKLAWQGSLSNRKNYWKFAYGASYTSGRYDSISLDDELSEERISEAFDKFEYYVFVSSLIGGKHRFAIEPKLYVRGQRAGEVSLPGLESFGLSGIYGVRSAATGSASADSGMLQSLELHFPNALTKTVNKHPLNLTPYLFLDNGSGETIIDENTTLDLDELEGYGIGLNLLWGRFSASLSYAKAKNEINPEVEDDSQVYVQLVWR